MEDSRPGNLTLGVNNCVKSDGQVENAQTLRLDLKKQTKNTPTSRLALVQQVHTLATELHFS